MSAGHAAGPALAPLAVASPGLGLVCAPAAALGLLPAPCGAVPRAAAAPWAAASSSEAAALDPCATAPLAPLGPDGGLGAWTREAFSVGAGVESARGLTGAVGKRGGGPCSGWAAAAEQADTPRARSASAEMESMKWRMTYGRSICAHRAATSNNGLESAGCAGLALPTTPLRLSSLHQRDEARARSGRRARREHRAHDAPRD